MRPHKESSKISHQFVVIAGGKRILYTESFMFPSPYPCVCSSVCTREAKCKRESEIVDTRQENQFV
jgi:hypothetical protein